MDISRHVISADLDARLIGYASRSWSAHEAVYALQQMTCLLPVYARNLESVYGPAGVGEARRLWAVAADLAAAMTGMPAALDTLVALGFGDAVAVDHLGEVAPEFRLAGSVALEPLDLESASLGDVSHLLVRAEEVDRVARPLLARFRSEVEAYDAEDHGGGLPASMFRRLSARVGDTPEDFPAWDGRPLFLDEQRALLDYLAKNAGADLVVDHLVDEHLGRFLLEVAGVVRRSEITDGLVIDVDRVPVALLDRSVKRLCEEVGETVLGALRVFDGGGDLLDRLFVAEMAVDVDLGIDVSAAFVPARRLAVEGSIRKTFAPVVDLTDRAAIRWAPVAPYEFPDLTGR